MNSRMELLEPTGRKLDEFTVDFTREVYCQAASVPSTVEDPGRIPHDTERLSFSITMT